MVLKASLRMTSPLDDNRDCTVRATTNPSNKESLWPQMLLNHTVIGRLCSRGKILALKGLHISRAKSSLTETLPSALLLPVFNSMVTSGRP